MKCQDQLWSPMAQCGLTKRPDRAGMICSGPLLSYRTSSPKEEDAAFGWTVWLRSAGWGDYPVKITQDEPQTIGQ